MRICVRHYLPKKSFGVLIYNDAKFYYLAVRLIEKGTLLA